jgi:DNA polymerase-3 subunit beta
MPAGKSISLTYLGGQGTGGGRLRVVCGKSKFELATLSPDDFPPFSSAGSQRWQFEIEASQLRGLLAAVKHAVSKDEARHYLNGIHMHVSSEEPVHLKAVATNGHILAMQSCLAPTGAYGMPPIIIPRDTVAEMVKLLPDNDQLVTLTVSSRMVWLEFPGGLSFGSKLIEGTYPDYDRVIPQGHPHCVRCDSGTLAASIDRVATLCGDKAHQVVVLMNPKGGLTLSVQNPEIGSAQDKIETVEMAGKKAAIGFNSRYLLQMLASYTGATVELRYSDAASPILMRLAGDASQTGLQVLMPMRHNIDAEKLGEAA